LDFRRNRRNGRTTNREKRRLKPGETRVNPAGVSGPGPATPVAAAHQPSTAETGTVV